MIDTKRKRLYLSLALVLILLSGYILISTIGDSEFHKDEPGWISSSIYYTNLLAQGNFTKAKWANPDLGPWGEFNPQLGKIILGIGLRILEPDQEFRNIYDFEKTEIKNRDEGNIPPRELLYSARKVSTFFGILCVLLLFSFGIYLKNYWIGLVAALLLMFNEVFIMLGTQAMMDIFYNFFLLCLYILGIKLVDKTSKKRFLVLMILFGAFTGLASSVKLMGMIIGSIIILCVLVYKSIFEDIKGLFFYLSGYLIIAVGVTYILNPIYYLDLGKLDFNKLKRELELAKDEPFLLEFTRVSVSESEDDNLIDQYPQLTNLSQPLKIPIHFIKWFLAMHPQTELADTFGGNRILAIHDLLFFQYSTFKAEVFFLMVGFALSIKSVLESTRQRIPTPYFLLTIYFLISYLFTVVFVKVDWHRYYLPTIISGRIIIAVGIIGSFDFIRNSYLQLKVSLKRQT